MFPILSLATRVLLPCVVINVASCEVGADEPFALLAYVHIPSQRKLDVGLLGELVGLHVCTQAKTSFHFQKGLSRDGREELAGLARVHKISFKQNQLPFNKVDRR